MLERATSVAPKTMRKERTTYPTTPTKRLGPQAHKPLRSIDGETDENGACKENAKDSGEKKPNEKR
jgi:hypothetical protein